MSRQNFQVEQGYEIAALNGDLLVAQLSGSAAPGGDTGVQDAAPIGSIYQRTSGAFYVKTANAGALADWKIIPVELSAGYTPANGDPATGDSFEEAIEKLDANQDDIQSASGLAQGAVDYGAFTGTTIPDNSTSKAALQALETAYEETDQNVDDLITLSGMPENSTDLGTFTGATISDNESVKGALQDLETALELIEGGAPILVSGITTLQDLDTLLVDNVHSAEWEIVAWEEATPANKKFMKVTALHDGTAAADAANIDDTVHTKLKVGSNFNLVIDVDVNGTGAAQTMRLRASSSTAGVSVEVRRTGVLISS